MRRRASAGGGWLSRPQDAEQGDGRLIRGGVPFDAVPSFGEAGRGAWIAVLGELDRRM